MAVTIAHGTWQVNDGATRVEDELDARPHGGLCDALALCELRVRASAKLGVPAIGERV